MPTPQRSLRPITPDALASYLADVRRTPLLSPDAQEAERLPSSEDTYVYASILHEVRALLEHLEPRQTAILRARFGFDGEPQSLAEIGRELGLSRERVRQLAGQARRQLYALAKDKALDEYLN